MFIIMKYLYYHHTVSISKQYIKEIKDQLGYSAVWLPTINVRPGDVGMITNYEYRPVTNLSALGIPFEIEKGNVQAECDYSSRNAVSVSIKAAGQIPSPGSALLQGDAGINVKFAKNNAVLFRLSRCSSTVIKNQNRLKEQVLDRNRSHKWDKKWVVVIEAVTAAMATIITSHGDNAQIDLKVQGNIGQAELGLISLDAGFQILQESDIAMKIIASKNLSPLFKTSTVRKPFLLFGDEDFMGPPENEVEFGTVDYEDFEAKIDVLM